MRHQKFVPGLVAFDIPAKPRNLLPDSELRSGCLSAAKRGDIAFSKLAPPPHGKRLECRKKRLKSTGTTT